MDVNISITRKIVVNGKEYHSIDELPPALREAYEKAMASGVRTSHTTRIVFNGHAYETPGAMPTDVRQAYEAAVGSLPGHVVESSEWTTHNAGPIAERAAASPRILNALVAGAVLLAVLYWMYGW